MIIIGFGFVQFTWIENSFTNFLFFVFWGNPDKRLNEVLGMWATTWVTILSEFSETPNQRFFPLTLVDGLNPDFQTWEWPSRYACLEISSDQDYFTLLKTWWPGLYAVPIWLHSPLRSWLLSRERSWSVLLIRSLEIYTFETGIVVGLMRKSLNFVV